MLPSKKEYKIRDGEKAIELCSKKEASEISWIYEKKIYELINKGILTVYYVPWKKKSFLNPQELIYLKEERYI